VATTTHNAGQSVLEAHRIACEYDQELYDVDIDWSQDKQVFIVTATEIRLSMWQKIREFIRI